MEKKTDREGSPVAPESHQGSQDVHGQAGGRQGTPDPAVSSGSRQFVNTIEPPPRRPTFWQKLQRHMAAVAYAEAGEFQSARELLEPAGKPPAVLLVVEGAMADPGAFSYALNLCKRTGADLDILHVMDKSSADSEVETAGSIMAGATGIPVTLERMVEETGVTFKVTARRGAVDKRVLDYAKRHKNVSMVVLDSPRSRESSVKDKAWVRFLEEMARNLSIPITTVRPKEVAPVSS